MACLKKKDPVLATCLSARNCAPPANPSGLDVADQASHALVGGSGNAHVASPAQIGGLNNVIEDEDARFATELEATLNEPDAQHQQGLEDTPV